MDRVLRRGGAGAGDAAEPFAATVLALALVFLFVPLVVVLFSFHETGALSFPFEGFSCAGTATSSRPSSFARR